MVKANPELGHEGLSNQEAAERIAERHQNSERMVDTLDAALQKMKSELNEVRSLKDTREEATGIYDQALVDQLNISRDNLSETDPATLEDLEQFIDELRSELEHVDAEEDIPDDLYNQLTIVSNTYSDPNTRNAEDRTLSSLESKWGRLANGYLFQLERTAELNELRTEHRSKLLEKLAGNATWLDQDNIPSIIKAIESEGADADAEAVKQTIDQMADRYDRAKLASENTDALLDLLKNKDRINAEDVHRVYGQILQSFGDAGMEDWPVRADKLAAAGHTVKEINQLYIEKVGGTVGAPKLQETIDGLSHTAEEAKQVMKDLYADLRTTLQK